MTHTRKPTLCVDFDGVIHAYSSPWTNAETISDGPVPGALRWLWKAAEWFEVVVYSSRSKTMAGCDAMLVWMMEESRKEFDADHPMCNPEETTDLVDGITRDKYPITFANEKPAAFLTIDDRAICFEGDWSEIEPADLLSFKPWNKREPIDPVAESNRTKQAIAPMDSGISLLETILEMEMPIRGDYHDGERS